MKPNYESLSEANIITARINSNILLMGINITLGTAYTRIFYKKKRGDVLWHCLIGKKDIMKCRIQIKM